MAGDREVSWTARANFSGLFSAIRRLSRDTNSLSRENDRLTSSSQNASNAQEQEAASLRGLAAQMGEAARRQAESARAADEAAAAHRRAASSSDAQRVAMQAHTDAIDDNTSSQNNNRNAISATVASRNANNNVIQQTTNALRGENNAQNENISLRQRLISTIISAQTAQGRFRGTIQSVAAAERDATSARRAFIRATEQARAASYNLARAEETYARTSNNPGANAAAHARALQNLTQAQIANEGASIRESAARDRVSRTHARLRGEIIASNTAMATLRNVMGGLGAVFQGAGQAAGGLLGIFGRLAGVGLIAMISQLIPLIMTLGAGFTALVSAMAPAVGILGAIPSLILGAGTAVGVLGGAFGGMGKALKAYGTQQDQAAKSTQQSAKAAAQQAISIRKAKDAVSKAQQDAARNAEKAARRVKDAEESAAEQVAESASRITEAKEKAAEADKRAADRVADAREKAAEDIASAQRAIVSAEKNLQDAQEDSRSAQIDLNRARKDAVEYLKDMERAARDASLSEESATISLEEARLRLAETMEDPDAGDLDRRKAELALREATARLDDARARKKEAIEENAEAQAKGVEGTKIMADAQERAANAADKVLEAQQSLADSQKNLVKTQQDAAKSISEAISEQVKTRSEGAKSIADAEKAHAKTQRDSARAVADAKEAQAESIRSSNEAIKNAQQNLNDVLKKQSFDEAIKGANAYEQAMAKLTPAQRQFVLFLQSMKPEMDKIRATAAAGLLPGVEAGMRAMFPLFPVVNKGVDGMAKAMGFAASEIGKAAGSAEGVSALTRVFDSNTKAGQNAAAGAGGYTRALIRLMDATRPLVEWIGKLIGDFGNYLDRVTKTNTETGKMAGFFEKSKTTLQQLGRILKNIGGIFYGIGKASADTGRDVLDDLEKWTKKVRDFNNSTEGQNKLKKYFEDVKPQLDAVGRFVAKLSSELRDLTVADGFVSFMDAMSREGGGIDTIGRFLDMLNDSEISANATEMLSSFGKAVMNVLDSGGMGILEQYIGVLTKLFNVFAWIAELPGVGTALLAIATGLAAIKAVKLIGTLTGVRQLYGMASGRYQTRQAAAGVENPRSLAGAAAARTGGYVASGARAVGRGTSQFGAGLRGAQPPLPTAPLAAGRAMRQAGTDAATGFTRGVSASSRLVRNAANQMGRDFLSAFKLILGIRSPSTVMALQADYTIQGFVNSIYDSMGQVRRAAQSIKAAVVEGVRGTGAAASAAMGRVVPTGGRAATTPAARAAAPAVVPPVAAAAPRAGLMSGSKGKMAAGAGGLMATAAAASMIPGPMGEAASKILMVTMAISGLIPILGMLLSPIGLVIAAVAAIGVALVVLYKKNETFRNFVNSAWKSIKEAVVGAWVNHIWPALKQFGSFIKDNVIPIVIWAVKNVLVPYWQLVGKTIAFMWNNVVKPVFGFMVGFIKNVIVPTITWLFSNIVKPYFKFIGDVISFMWNNVVKPAFNAFDWFMRKVLGPTLSWLHNNVVSPVFKAIGSIISGAWNNVIKPIFGFFEGFIKKTLAPTLSWFRDKVVKPVWDTVTSIISGAWNKGIKPIFTALNNFITKDVPGAFGKGRDAIEKAWNQLQGIVKKPIDFFVNTVYNNGIRKVVNKLAGFVGMKDPLGEVKMASGGQVPSSSGRGPGREYVGRYATGGKVRGYSAGDKQDNVPAMLTAGEWVQPVASVRHYGPEFMEAIRQRKLPKFNTGGPVYGSDGRQRLARGGTAGGRISYGADVSGRYPITWPQLWNYVKPRFPGLVMTSNFRRGSITRTGSVSSHAYGTAIDIAGPGNVVAAAMKHMADNFGSSFRDLIYSPLFGRRMIYNGNWIRVPHDVTYRDHLDHGHMGLKLGQNLGGGKAGGSNVLFEASGQAGEGFFSKMFNTAKDYALDLFGGAPKALIEKVVNPLLSKIPGLDTPVGGMIKKIPGQLIGKIADTLMGRGERKGVASGVVSPEGIPLPDKSPGREYRDKSDGNISRWTSTVKAALARVGLPVTDTYVSAWLRQIQSESGGNPNIAQQIRDINGTGERAGVGLVQVIPGTFAQYRDPELPNDRRNPLSNLVAGMRYARSRYGVEGMLRQIGHGHGYAQGGMIPGVGNTDSVPAMLMPGEFVLRKAAVKAIGLSNLHALNYADRNGRGGAASKAIGGVQYFATGGPVTNRPNVPTVGAKSGFTIPTGAIGGFGPGMRGHAFISLIRALFKLPLGRYGMGEDAWGRDLTDAYTKANYTVPELNSTVGDPKISDAQSKVYAWWLRNHRVTGRSPLSGKKTIGPGSRDFATIRQIQKWIGAKVDGQYGKVTASKVKAWQAKYQLRQTGSVDAATWDALGKEFYSNNYKGAGRLIESSNAFKSNPWVMAKIFSGANGAKIFSSVLGAQRNPISWDANNWTGGKNLSSAWIKSLQQFVGASSRDGVWTTAMPAWIKFLLDRGMGRTTSTIFPPWKQKNALEERIESQNTSNLNTSEFLKLLDTIAQWGLPNLVEKLQTDGVEEGLPVARVAAKDRALATQYDTQLKTAAELAKTGTVDYSKFIAEVMQSGPQKGIRNIAQTLGVNDFDVVRMFEELIKTGRLKSSERTARLEREARQYHTGTFYANTGGRVPGVGNSDTVPAMLTPGEFVLRKAAVKALGLDTVQRLNNPQYFANGGMVYSPDVSAMTLARPSASFSPRVAARNATGSVSNVQNYNTKIFNPVREPSARSVNAMLRRNATLGFHSVGEDVVMVVEGENG